MLMAAWWTNSSLKELTPPRKIFQDFTNEIQNKKWSNSSQVPFLEEIIVVIKPKKKKKKPQECSSLIPPVTMAILIKVVLKVLWWEKPPYSLQQACSSASFSILLKWRRFNWVSSPMEQQNVFFPPSASPARQRHPLTDTCTASTQLDVNQSLCLCILLVRPNLHQWMYWPHKAGKCNFRDEKMKQRDRPHSSMPKFAQKVSARPGNQALV